MYRYPVFVAIGFNLSFISSDEIYEAAKSPISIILMAISMVDLAISFSLRIYAAQEAQSYIYELSLAGNLFGEIAALFWCLGYSFLILKLGDKDIFNILIGLTTIEFIGEFIVMYLYTQSFEVGRQSFNIIHTVLKCLFALSSILSHFVVAKLLVEKLVNISSAKQCIIYFGFIILGVATVVLSIGNIFLAIEDSIFKYLIIVDMTFFWYSLYTWGHDLKQNRF
jgi:hypothetical protein